MPAPRTRLIIAASDTSADQLYATRFFAPDPFLFLQKNGKRFVLLSDLEVDRGRETVANGIAVEAFAEYEKPLEKKAHGKRPSYEEVAIAFLRKHRVKAARVPGSFPLGLTRKLEEAGLRIEPADGFFWPEREHKRAEELQALRAALRMTAKALRRGFEVVREAEIGPGRRLKWRGKPLTSERLRAEIDTVCLQLGGLPANTIVAGGAQACDPHERGSGPLKANELIILDCFPRDARTGFYGDLTRTVVKGAASDAQRKLWETVGRGQKRAFAGMRPRADGAKVHEAVKQFFAEEGYPTEQCDGRWTGFFHGTGHGLGLDLHEAPRFSATKFKTGQVLTVEPGLYYPGLGGCRTEDVATVTSGGAQWLSQLEDPFVIE